MSSETHGILKLSGLEPLIVSEHANFINIGERTNISGSIKFKKLIKEDNFAAAVEVAREQVENGAQVIDVNMDDGMIDGEKAMVTFLNQFMSNESMLAWGWRVPFFRSALLLLILTLPISLIIALLIKLESRGPVFYKQERTGLYNETFKVIKFRSMNTEAEKNGAQWANKNDSRVTRVGRFIRATRIDELPQVINIIRGDMSIVGPRPEREIFIKDLEKEIPYYRFRHAVKPGVTGLAQVSYPYGASLEDAVWKHKYDIYYIKNHSTWADIKILFKTFKVVLLGMGH